MKVTIGKMFELLPMYKGFIFDLDGTLVDSLPGLTNGLNRALSLLSYPRCSLEEVSSMVGRGTRDLCRRAMHHVNPAPDWEEHVLELYEIFTREYKLSWQDGTRPFDGIMPMLQALAAQGSHLAVLSNKPHDVTVPLVREKLPGIPFDPVMGFSEVFPRKPDPAALWHIAKSWSLSPKEVCMVGDSAHDGNTAVNAGSGLVLVDWGYSSREALNAFGVPVCDSPAELAESLNKLFVPR